MSDLIPYHHHLYPIPTNPFPPWSHRTHNTLSFVITSTYDLCTMASNIESLHGCPDEFTANGVPCRCPLRPGEYRTSTGPLPIYLDTSDFPGILNSFFSVSSNVKSYNPVWVRMIHCLRGQYLYIFLKFIYMYIYSLHHAICAPATWHS